MGPQLLVFLVLIGALALFAWGRWRYDIVAVASLLALVIPGVISVQDAFAGFGHVAVVTVAAVLVLSRGLMNSGLVDVLSSAVGKIGTNKTVQIGVLSSFVAVCSAFMNNVGALALILPVAIRMARSAKRSPDYLLIPVAFASLLGGLMTLIGTPPNIIVSTFRAKESGVPFGMFDFTPVGAAIAGAGVLFMALVGWRLIPSRPSPSSQEELFRINEYTAELSIPEKSKAIGKSIREVGQSTEKEILVASLVREGKRIPAPRAEELLETGDILIVEGDPEAINAIAQGLGLKLVAADTPRAEKLTSEHYSIVEAVIRSESPIIGRTVQMMSARWAHGVNVLAVARQGKRLTGRLRDVRFRAGGVLLIQARQDIIQQALDAIGCLPLAERSLRIGQPRRIALALGIFGSAIAMSAFGLLDLPVALLAAALAMVLVGLVSLRDSYDSVDWPVIVLLGAMIPVGGALESTGGAETIASFVLSVAKDASPFLALAILLIVVMTLSDIVNNAAAAVLMCPVAIGIAKGLGVSSDPFLMAVAIGSSAAFLTPIGHQSNTLVLGPGGYQFGDYWRPGLPLSIVYLLVALPMIVWVWPFS